MSDPTTQPGTDTAYRRASDVIMCELVHGDTAATRSREFANSLASALEQAGLLAVSSADAVVVLSEDNAWLHNTLRDRDARIAELESTVARLVAELDQVKADANKALQRAESRINVADGQFRMLGEAVDKVTAHLKTLDTDGATVNVADLRRYLYAEGLGGLKVCEGFYASCESVDYPEGGKHLRGCVFFVDPAERDVTDRSPCDCSPDCADDQRSA